MTLSHEEWREGRACANCGLKFELDFKRRSKGLRKCDDCETGNVRPEIERAQQAAMYMQSHEQQMQSMYTKLDQLTIKILGVWGDLRSKFLSPEDKEIWKGNDRKFAMDKLLEAERAVETILLPKQVRNRKKLNA